MTDPAISPPSVREPEWHDSSPDRIPPGVNRAWLAHAPGIEALRLVKLPTRRPAPHEVLVCVEAVGLCASDVKILNQGPRHARLAGHDMAAKPVIAGHEVCLRVVEPGADWAATYAVGSRWTVNPEIVIGGQVHCYGFSLPGGYQQWQVLGPEVLSTAMLAVPEGLTAAAAALTEPWGCVYRAYRHHRPTQGVAPGGTTWLIGAGPVGLMHLEKALADRPARLVVSEANPHRRDHARQRFTQLASQAGVELIVVDSADLEQAACRESLLGPTGADDVVILAPDPRLVDVAMPHLARGGVLNIFAGFPQRETATRPIDLYDLHYRNLTVISTSGTDRPAMSAALAAAVAGRIHADSSVAAVGGIDSVLEGLRATALGTYPGRVVIYPHTREPLQAVKAAV